MATEHRQPLKSLVIVGGGIVAWTMAAAIAQKLARQPAPDNKLSIRVIETGFEADFPAESTLASVHHFHRFLGLKERQLMAATNATFKMANHYQGWHAGDSSSAAKDFFHADSPYGSMIDSIAFQHHLTRLRQLGEEFDLNELSLPALAAREAKFQHPAPGQKSLPFSYSLHLDCHAYADGLKIFSEQLGVRTIRSDIKEIRMNADEEEYVLSDAAQEGSEHETTQHIRQILLENDAVVEAELFIDCTREGLLIGHNPFQPKGLGVTYLDWSHHLPCDKFLTTVAGAESAGAPVTRMQLHDAGWLRSIPLQTGIAHEYFYSSADQSDEQAVQQFADLTGDPNLTTACSARTQRAGRRDLFWVGNCVAVGAAAGSLERFAVSDFHLAQSAALRLLDFFPDSSLRTASTNSARDEYNSLCAEEYDRILDFHVLHYVLAARSANESCSSFWQKRQRSEPTDSLAHKLNLFEETGHFPFYERETFSEKTWISLMLGLDVQPKTYQAALDMPQASIERSSQALQKIAEIARETTKRMPSHQEYLQQYCAAQRASVSAAKRRVEQHEPQSD